MTSAALAGRRRGCARLAAEDVVRPAPRTRRLGHEGYAVRTLPRPNPRRERRLDTISVQQHGKQVCSVET